MPVREINIDEAIMKVLDKTMEIMPETTINLVNMLTDKAHELYVLEAKNTPTRKDGSPSLWGEKYASTIKTQHVVGKVGGIAKVFVDEQDKNFRFVEHVEKGIEQWSIKDALLKGKAARRNQSLYGRTFVIVPFRYRVPGRMRPTSSAFAGIMPVDVYKKAKQGEKISKDYGHLAGLTKVSEGVHSQYMTFRMVTPDSKGWVYPKKAPQKVFEKVQKKIDKMVEGTIVNFINGFLKDIKKESEKS